MEQPAIGHRARHGADIVGQLRAHQDDHRDCCRSGAGRRRRRVRSSVRARRQVVPPGPSSSSDALGRQTARIASAGRSRAPCGPPAVGDRGLDAPRHRRRRRNHACGSVPAADRCSVCRAARSPAHAGLRPAHAHRPSPRIGQRVHRGERQRRVQIVAQRVHARLRHCRRAVAAGRAFQRAIEAVQLPPRLGQRLRRRNPARRGNACAAAAAGSPRPARLRQHVAHGEEIAERSWTSSRRSPAACRYASR